MTDSAVIGPLPCGIETRVEATILSLMPISMDLAIRIDIQRQYQISVWGGQRLTFHCATPSLSIQTCARSLRTDKGGIRITTAKGWLMFAQRSRLEMHFVQKIVFRLGDGQLRQNGARRVDLVAVGIRVATRTPFRLIAFVVAEEGKLRSCLLVDVRLCVEQFVGLMNFLFLIQPNVKHNQEFHILSLRLTRLSRSRSASFRFLVSASSSLLAWYSFVSNPATFCSVASSSRWIR